MNKSFSLLLGAAAVVASLGAASAAPQRPSPTSAGSKKYPHVLIRASKGVTIYDQNDNDFGVGAVSQNFEASFDIYDSQGADDFTVPGGATWTVREVDVTGVYFNGSGPAVSENVFFYKDKHGFPGKLVKKGLFTVAGTDSAGSFAISLGKGIKLKAGTYWVSVQVNMDFNAGGEWAWEQRAIVNGNAAKWQNPGNGFSTGCTTWADEFTCLGGVPGQRPPDGGIDHMFTLKGKTN